MKKDGFSGRTGLILAALGMAIGTGNLWRFPRIAAQHEGGAFLIPWLIFLFTWSIPILIAEFTLGKTTGRGPIGAFARLLGRQTAWMGAFMAFTTVMIATYYSVVTGWTLKYVVLAIQDGIAFEPATTAEAVQANHLIARSHFESFTEHAWLPLAYHLAAVALGVMVIWRGVRGGVELACKILIPTLFIGLLVGAAWAITQLSGSHAGLSWLNPLEADWEQLRHPRIWLDALSQSAWSTGAGWGLILAYGAYARRNEDAVVNNTVAGIGNNCASLLAALFIFPATFALLGSAGLADPEIRAALKDAGPGNTGVAFQYVPFIFNNLGESGRWATILFFSGLFVAALSSLIAMYEMGTRVLMDMGLGRGKAVLIIGILGAGVGVPSAVNMDFFVTMDWVWGIGLILGGLMVVWAVHLYGIDRYRRELINASGATIKLRWLWNWIFMLLLPAQAVALLWWWLGQAEPDWDPLALGHYNLGAPVIWCGTTMVLFMLLSPWLGRWSLRGASDPAVSTAEPTEESRS